MSKVNDPQSVDTSRRRFFAVTGTAIGAAVLVGALPRDTRAADLPHLTSDDPTAKALNYTEDNTKAPAPHQPGQDCAACNFFQGGSATYGPCQLFPGKAVHSSGWCSGFAKKA
jgi:hypothetical protein